MGDTNTVTILGMIMNKRVLIAIAELRQQYDQCVFLGLSKFTGPVEWTSYN